MLKLKLQYFCHLMGIASSMEMTLILGMIEGKRKGLQQRTSLLNEHELSKLREIVKDREAWHAALRETVMS